MTTRKKIEKITKSLNKRTNKNGWKISKKLLAHIITREQTLKRIEAYTFIKLETHTTMYLWTKNNVYKTKLMHHENEISRIAIEFPKISSSPRNPLPGTYLLERCKKGK